jgi:hypothetical protein
MCGRTGAALRCSRCKSTTYCSSACQRTDWKDHKALCAIAASALGSVLASSAAGSPRPGLAALTHDPVTVEDYQACLAAHRARYASFGKQEFWWLFDDVLADIGKCLLTHSHVVVDDFVLPTQTADLRGEVMGLMHAGLLTRGALGGGRLGTNVKYTHDLVRGDLMGWFNGNEDNYNWQHLPPFGKKVRTDLQRFRAVVD